MSWQLDQERGIKSKIEMPPMAEQPQQAQPEVQEQPQQQKYEVHPSIASEFVEPVEAEEVQEPEQEVEEVQAAPEPSKVESKKENDLRALREKAKRAESAESERDELKRRVYDLELARHQQQKPKIEEPKEEEFNLADDELVEAKHFKRYDKKIRELEEKLSNSERATSLQTVDARLKARYPDIDSVVSQENLESLRESYPELAESINSTSDFYNKAVSAYTLIKKLGIAPEQSYVEDKQRAQKNSAKPRPLVSVSPQQGSSALSKANEFANGLTDDLKAQLRKEMEAARRAM